MARRILGIDPGFGRMGYGVVEQVGRDQYRALTHGCVQTDAGASFGKRLLEIEQACTELLSEFSPELMAIEQLYFSKNVTTGMRVSHARGIIVASAARADVPSIDLNPMQIKQIITGHGTADKAQMQRMIQMMLSLKEIPKPDDAADALAIALCGFLHRP